MSSGQKGVMLCQRPGPSQMDTGPGPKPFIPSSSPGGLEPLGLIPTQKAYPTSLAPKPINPNVKSFAHVRDLEEENRLAALAEEERRMAAAAKAGNVTAFGAQLRAAILSGDDVSFWRAAKQTEGVRQSLDVSKARAAAGPAPKASGGGAAADDDVAASKASMLSFVDDLLKEATFALECASPTATRTDGTRDASTSGATGAASAAAAAAPTPRSAGGGSRKGRGGGSKPAWALTEAEVAQLEDAEEEELLKFADDLDFDSFMAALDDPELQDCVKAGCGEGGGKGPAPGEDPKTWRKNLVRAMNHAAMKRVAAAAAGRRATAERDDDGAVSVAAGSDGALSRATATSRLRSEAGAAKRSALSEARAGGGDGGGWDSSTRAAEDVGRMERSKAAAAEAFEFLRENPELRAVHSPASVRAIITKTDAAGAAVAGAAKAAS
ncbi:hypothetical protein PLESTB_001509700 [Pleodorina starrii]|uniref:Uncharacterized protein n=1 Tax=Pleodorina starrii TaxID=330485 RepID=A0A9W6BWN8_9CHLO|nr:hypothetical protein PLESTB_001509700 [Pleodorina starrii]